MRGRRRGPGPGPGTRPIGAESPNLIIIYFYPQISDYI